MTVTIVTMLIVLSVTVRHVCVVVEGLIRMSTSDSELFLECQCLECDIKFNVFIPIGEKLGKDMFDCPVCFETTRLVNGAKLSTGE